MSGNIPITVAYGDGIGPEIMQATLDIIQAGWYDVNGNRISIGKSISECVKSRYRSKSRKY